jgi:hypothetical protein
MEAPFFASAFLRGQSPPPATVAAADSALAAARTEAVAAQERVRLAALAWEHECTAADALARRVTEAERFLHTSEVEHVATSSHQASLTAQSARAPLGQADPMIATSTSRPPGSRTSRT